MTKPKLNPDDTYPVSLADLVRNEKLWQEWMEKNMESPIEPPVIRARKEKEKD